MVAYLPFIDIQKKHGGIYAPFKDIHPLYLLLAVRSFLISVPIQSASFYSSGCVNHLAMEAVKVQL